MLDTILKHVSDGVLGDLHFLNFPGEHKPDTHCGASIVTVNPQPGAACKILGSPGMALASYVTVYHTRIIRPYSGAHHSHHRSHPHTVCGFEFTGYFLLWHFCGLYRAEFLAPLFRVRARLSWCNSLSEVKQLIIGRTVFQILVF